MSHISDPSADPPTDPASVAHPSPTIFRIRDFRLFFSIRLLFTIGVFMQSVALGWQVYALARLSHTIEQSAFLVGMIGLVQFLPLFALALVAGRGCRPL